MILIKPSAELLCFTSGALQIIEVAGRTCYKSENKITDDSANYFAKKILENGHESVIEHASATVKFICDRGVSHEIVRHRLASYSQESTRYCDYSNGHITYIILPWIENVKEGIYNQYEGHPNRATENWLFVLWNCEKVYKQLREQGWTPEKARSVLPNNLKTELFMTANFREWRHFFKQRTSIKAHPQMRELAIPLLEEMKMKIPIIFDDIL